MPSRLLISVLSVAFVLAGCSQKAEERAAASDQAQTPQFAEFERIYVSPGMAGIEKLPQSMILDRGAAIRLLERAYAGSDAVSGVIVHEGRSFSAEPRLAFTYEGRSYLVVSHGMDDAAHVESGSLSFFIFDSPEGPPAYKLPFAADGGSFGQEAWIVPVRLNGQPAAIFSGGGTWQGCSNLASQIVRFTPTGILVSSWFPESHHNGSGVGPEDEIKLVGAQVSPDGSSIALRYLGESPSADGSRPLSESRTLILDGENGWVEDFPHWC